jgi:A/G-specific adenine glycosylase
MTRAARSPSPQATDVDALRSRLLDWYDANARTLPWRAPPGAARTDPYRVWLSEVMLQQTTVPHATPYFLEFLRRWPTVAHLAAAPDSEVMAAWAGLGYYARARNLLACARAVAGAHGGRFPDTEEGLRALPGLGPYTAAAVAAIAFDRPTNVVDGNVERVVARLFAVEDPLPEAKPELKRLADGLVRDNRPGDWAQALMDLGATVCRPKAPLCERCPLVDACLALETGAPESYPRRSAKAARPQRYGVAWLITRGREVALVRRPARGLLGGMLALPTTDWREARWSEAEALAHAPVAGDWRASGAIDHVFTHFALELSIRRLEAADAGEVIWTAREGLSALPSVFLKAARKGLA